MKQYLTMEELFPQLAQFSAQIQGQIEDLKNDMNVRFDRVEQRLDDHEVRLKRIEENMVQKTDFNHLFRALISSLSKKDILTKVETGYFFSQTQD